MTIYHVEGLHLADCRYGKGLFCGHMIDKGSNILTLEGPYLKQQDLPGAYSSVHDSYVQVGAELYMGPLTGLELYINHSCNPSAALIVDGEKAILLAIRDILAGNEIHFDYSTTMCDDDWEMDCLCGSVDCRKRILEFKHLPRGFQKKYIEMGIIPKYILNKMSD